LTAFVDLFRADIDRYNRKIQEIKNAKNEVAAEQNRLLEIRESILASRVAPPPPVPHAPAPAAANGDTFECPLA
jgi:hypothetical protein